ncbi:hypothetical protein J8L73_07945 [Pseudoalteromonas sp. MMG006]|uniref:hypothetical protein n=1 Tax=Pseudoalteromonas sp. MMG006 TaxID=2822683 RepID=UPI001B36A62B|nr:hypothetical protein [Pseudoalteromonas sp. MMG006]MBQ4799060.1 hypothetical protein [Pseudoalteromonas sp. MMG006]
MSIEETIKSQIEGSIVNDRYLESIAITLFNEAKVTADGYIFKKLVPAMTFYCFALESKLNTYGKEVFGEHKSLYKKFTSATLLGKFDWLLSKMDVEEHEILTTHRDTISNMVTFRNAVAHSKNIDFTEERELIGLENFGDKYLIAPTHEKDFMALRSIENCELFKLSYEFLERVWLVQSPKYFGSVDIMRGMGISSSIVVGR